MEEFFDVRWQREEVCDVRCNKEDGDVSKREEGRVLRCKMVEGRRKMFYDGRRKKRGLKAEG